MSPRIRIARWIAITSAGLSLALPAADHSAYLPTAPSGWTTGDVDAKESRVEVSGHRYPRLVLKRLDSGPGGARVAISVDTFDCTRAAIVERARTDPAVLEKVKEPMKPYRYENWPALARSDERGAVNSIVIWADRCAVVSVGGRAVTETTLRSYLDRTPLDSIRRLVVGK